MAEYLSGKQIQDFLNSDMTKCGFCKKIGVHQRVFDRTFRALGLAVPQRKRIYKTGSEHAGWKGGRLTDKSGYILVFSPEHPTANRHGYVREHRLVMEKHIGRFLRQGETVHHKNHTKNDNRIDNLVLFQRNSDHLRHELKGRRPKWTHDGTIRIREAHQKWIANGCQTPVSVNLEEDDLAFYLKDCGFHVKVVALLLHVDPKTVAKYQKRFGIHNPPNKGYKRLTQLGVLILAKNQSVSKFYDQVYKQASRRWKKKLGIVYQTPL